MLILRELKSAPAPEFMKMTFPSYRGLLASLGKDSSVFSFVAIKDKRAAGLVLGQVKNGDAELLSVYVSPLFRREGIAGKLLRLFEKKAAEMKAQRIHAAVTTSMPGFEPMKKLFAKNAWSYPELHMKLINFSRKNLEKELNENPRYARYKNPIMPKGFELMKWAELPEEKIEEVKNRQNKPGGWTDEDTPFREPARMEKLNSLAILKDGVVAGWLINHRINGDTIRYNQVYNNPVEKGMRGVIIQAVLHAFWLHALHGPEKGCFIIYDWNTPLQKMFDKLMLKLVDSCVESFRVEKSLF
jgi:ribosomal protein S18 acetylase RimI-like enzyme